MYVFICIVIVVVINTQTKNIGNRRTASVRSVGYSDLFVLSKKDMWDVLKEYPAARVRLEAIAVKRLEKYKKAPLEKGMFCYIFCFFIYYMLGVQIFVYEVGIL